MPESKATPPEPPDQDEVEEVDESSDESFPASDPPSWAMGKTAERPPDAPAKGARARPEHGAETPGGPPPSGKR